MYRDIIATLTTKMHIISSIASKSEYEFVNVCSYAYKTRLEKLETKSEAIESAENCVLGN